MKKKIPKSLQQIICTIIIGGLVIGVFGPVATSQPSPSIASSTGNTLAKSEPMNNEPTPVPVNINPQQTTRQYTMRFSEADLHFDTLMGCDIVSMDDCSYLNELGNPMLPTIGIMVALPSGMKATDIHITSIQSHPLPGIYTVFPAQQPVPLGTTLNPSQIIPPNKTTYTSIIPYPAQYASLGTQTDLAGQSMIEITLCPLHYLPLQKKLILTTSITFSIEGQPGNTCGDYLPVALSDNDRAIYQQMIQDMVINPQDVALQTSPNPQPMGVGPGDYEYVIITQASWVTAFQPLADWKTQKGVPATIITTSWIYNNGGYSGTNVQKIRAFVQDAYNTWGTTYVLLGGDTDVVPCNYQTFPGVDSDPVPNDAYYADFDSDWVCEVNIGRASVTGPGTGNGQIGNFINKVLTYETNPPLTNYAQKAGFFGFDLDFMTHAEQCKINIDNAYVPANWTVTTVYDSQGGNHLTNVIAALNAGQNIVNHADHSNTDCMGTGYVNHNWLLYSFDMDALTNGNKQSILYSMGCDPCAFDENSCIAEHFVRNSNGGGIAFIGNTRYGWYNYGQYNTLSMAYDVHFFQSLFSEGLYHLGAAFSDHKNDVIQSHSGDDTYQYCFTEITLLGDPELPVWTVNPAALVVEHPSTLPPGSSTFTVHVETSSGANVQNAYVCLWKGDEIYQTGSTGSNGDVTFTVLAQTSGIMDVTVTKHNYIPSQTTALVLAGEAPPYEPSAPFPSDGAINVPITTVLSWAGGDPNPGDIVTYDVYFGTSTTPPRVVNNQSGTSYNPGTLIYATTYHWMIVAWDNGSESTAGQLWSFTTKPNLPPVFGTPSPLNGSLGNPLQFTWSIPISDPDGDSFTWMIQCSNGQVSSGTGAANGTKSVVLSGLSYLTTYTIWVNATDPTGSGLYTRRWYTFTTIANQKPIFGGPTPVNGSTGNPLDVSWSIPISDPEGDLLSWSIQCNNGQMTNDASDSNGTKTLDLSDLAYSMTYKVWVNATDPLGSGQYTKRWYTFDTVADDTPPVTTLTLNGTQGDNGWFVSSVTVTLVATDAQSGVMSTVYKVDSENWTDYTGAFVVSGDANHTLSYYSIDAAGNTEDPITTHIGIDQTGPSVTLSKEQIDLLDIIFTAQASDDTSGVDRVEFYLDGALQATDTMAPYSWTWTGIGNFTVTATAYDRAGNKQSQSMTTPLDLPSAMKNSAQLLFIERLLSQQLLQ